MRILAISGSLRARSSNRAVLEAARALAPTGTDVHLFEGLAGLPHFNPDADIEPLPPAVAAWRAEIARADALLFCSPEYARGVPGSLKNAIDWLVSGFEIIGKPIASINASPLSSLGQESLLATLRTIGAVVEDASIRLPLPGGTRTAEAIVSDEALASALRAAVARLVAAAAAPGART
jgi:chromate reductase, NAD(P)H dehydrogenase (quinone)